MRPKKSRELSALRYSGLIGIAIIALACPHSLSAAETHDEDFTSLSLEELLDVEVVSASKRPQHLSKTAAAIFVITNEDIRRSGVTNIPDALRMAPGVQVAQIDANKWAVTARGDNGRFSNKLLVLIDGRSIYTPIFSGVLWDEHQPPLEDIDRIEVIRGPGATVWGANAVNGVINIITKHARDTQGMLASAGAGTEERYFGFARYGGTIGDELFYRTSVKYFNRDEQAIANGHPASDDWDQWRIGSRFDWAPENGYASATLQGALYRENFGTEVTQPLPAAPFSTTFDDTSKTAGGFVLGRWNYTISDDSNVSIQSYYDKTDRREQGIDLKAQNFDLDFQHDIKILDRHRVVWGLGYRFTKTDIDGKFIASIDPEERSSNLFSAFLQDEITLIDNELWLTVGSKFEHNEFSGFEYQPSARALYAPLENHSIWGAVSRAVRTPFVAEEDARFNQTVIPGAPPTVIATMGDRDVESEDLLAFELGYRTTPTKDISLDIATFYNVYDNFRSGDTGSPFFQDGLIVMPIDVDDEASGETFGVEVGVDWQVMPWLRLRGAYTYLNVDIDYKDTEYTEDTTPLHQASLRASFDLGNDWELDLWPRYVDNLRTGDIDSYVTLDARLAWRPIENVELAVVGQNLIDARHKEFETEFLDTTSTQVQRGVYGKLTIKF
ncbi:MAG: TonB-dependent receptor [Hyphomicrobiales bacterium]|nr:TonB-dependent receptor [Hyphomicrobiales bacterium]